MRKRQWIWLVATGLIFITGSLHAGLPVYTDWILQREWSCSLPDGSKMEICFTRLWQTETGIASWGMGAIVTESSWKKGPDGKLRLSSKTWRVKGDLLSFSRQMSILTLWFPRSCIKYLNEQVRREFPDPRKAKQHLIEYRSVGGTFWLSNDRAYREMMGAEHLHLFSGGYQIRGMTFLPGPAYSNGYYRGMMESYRMREPRMTERYRKRQLQLRRRVRDGNLRIRRPGFTPRRRGR